MKQLPLFDLEEYCPSHPKIEQANKLISHSELSTKLPFVKHLVNIHCEEVEIVSAKQLEDLLRTTPRYKEYAAFLLWGNEGRPELSLHFNGDDAYVHFWLATDGSHPGYQPAPSNRSKSLVEPYNITFLQVGASWGEYIQLCVYSTVFVEQAIEVAIEFGAIGKLPRCISWFEL